MMQALGCVGRAVGPVASALRSAPAARCTLASLSACGRALSTAADVGENAATPRVSALTPTGAVGDVRVGKYSLPAGLLPVKLETGGWKRPQISGRIAAKLRKQCIHARASGEEAPDWDALDAQWRPHLQNKSRHSRVPKGYKHDLTLFARVDKVQAALAAQDKRRADYKKTLPAKALSEGLLQYVKKNAWEK